MGSSDHKAMIEAISLFCYFVCISMWGRKHSQKALRTYDFVVNVNYVLWNMLKTVTIKRLKLTVHIVVHYDSSAWAIWRAEWDTGKPPCDTRIAGHWGQVTA